MTFVEIASAIVLAIAGHPVNIGCDAETNNPFPFPVAGWSYIGGNEMHLHSLYCRDLDPGVWKDSVTRGIALSVLIHEAAHSRGVRSEQCAEMYGGVLIYEYLERYYGIPMLSPASIRAGIAWTVINRDKPPQYRWKDMTACDREP